MERVYAVMFRYRNILAGAPLVFAFFSVLGEVENDWIIWPLAVLISASGVAVRGWSRVHCNYARKKRKTLASTGPYVYMRNPLYVGNTLVICGATIASGLLWLLPVVLVWCFLIYTGVIKFEEKRLLEKYGEVYTQYSREIPRWIPRRPQSPDKSQFSAPGRSFWATTLSQSTNLLILLPFIVKELNLLGLWSHP